MDSAKAFKGYEKVVDHESQVPIRHREPTSIKSLITAIAISAIFVAIAIIGFVAAGTTSDDDSVSDPAKSLKISCSVTRYPDSCLTSLASAVNGSTRTDPESIFKLSLQVSTKGVLNLSNAFITINEHPKDAAVRDCLGQFDDAMSRLNDSVSAMGIEPGMKALTKEKIGDVRMWISAAMTDLETCSDGLEEMGSTVGERIETQMRKSKELVSNSLAIVSRMKELHKKCRSTMH